MAGERRYTRIPPESTGDRIYMVHTARIPYVNKVDANYNWKIGEFYTVQDQTTNTITFHVHGVWEETSTSGYLEVHYDKNTKNITERQPGPARDIFDSDGVKIAETANPTGVEDIYVNTNHIMGYDNPEYGLDIDRFGSANVRFAEGPPEISAFGKLRTTEPKLLAQYDFSKSELNDQFVNSQEGKGSKSWEADVGAIRLRVSGDPDTNDRVTNTSNLFHPAIPNSGIFYSFAARTAGVDVGVVRNFGPFDATDGFFFQTFGEDGSGNTKLRVVHRYTLSGNATVNHAIEQADWNRDTLLGTGGGTNPSGMLLDLTKINNFWVDYQFVGGGRTRWGVFYKGERVICHEMNHANATDGLALSTHNPLGNPNRPLCWAIANRAGAGTPDGTASDLFAYGGAVYLESDADPLEEAAVRRYSNTSTLLLSGSTSTDYYRAGTSTTYAFTLSPAQYLPEAEAAIANGFTLSGGQRENHSIYKPELLQVSAYKDGDDTIDAKIEVRVFSKCVVRGENWQDVSFTTVQIDTDVGDIGHLAHGPELARFIIDGQGEFNFDNIFTTIQNGSVSNNSDQAFARNSQLLSSFSQSADPEGTGVERVVVKVKQHPIYGSNIHFFNDKNQVTLRDPTNASDPTILAGFSSTGSLKRTEGDWYYLSLIDRDEAWLYTSTTDIDNDRTPRQLTVSGVTGTITEGDEIYVVPEMTASILQSGSSVLRVEGRSTASLDIGIVSAAFTSSTGATGTVDSITTGSATSYPLDYKTSLLALSQADAGFTLSSGVGLADQNALYGPPPPRAAWTFMARNLTAKSYDVATRWNMTWKERIQ